MRTINFIERPDGYFRATATFADESEGLEHHGVLGMHRGERRWQYENGSLTPAGRIHYGVGQARKAVSSTSQKVKRAVKTFDDKRAENKAKKDVEKVFNRDGNKKPAGSKADIRNFERDRVEKGNEEAIRNFVKEIAKEDLNKVLNRDYIRGKNIPKNLDALVDEKVKEKKYQDYIVYLNKKYNV